MRITLLALLGLGATAVFLSSYKSYRDTQYLQSDARRTARAKRAFITTVALLMCSAAAIFLIP